MPGPRDATVSLIVAVAHDRVIGARNKLPWHISDDLRRFKQLTTGHPMVMGRKTFESIGPPLPGRTSIVVTRQRDFAAPGSVLVARDPLAALELAAGLDRQVFVIGGAEVFAATLGHATEVLATLVDLRVPEGDARFPALAADWHVAAAEEPRATEAGVRFAFLRLTRGAAADGCLACKVRRSDGPASERGLTQVLAAMTAGKPGTSS